VESETDLPDELLLLGGVRHVEVDVSEELLQGLLRVLLSRGPVLLRRRRPLQGRRQRLQVVLSEEETAVRDEALVTVSIRSL